MLNDDWVLTIKKAENGYVLSEKIPKTNDDGINFYGEEVSVIEEEDGENETLKKLLLKVAEWAGKSYDKFGKDNVNITFDLKGHKTE